jgi:hypothetical protein
MNRKIGRKTHSSGNGAMIDLDKPTELSAVSVGKNSSHNAARRKIGAIAGWLSNSALSRQVDHNPDLRIFVSGPRLGRAQ